MHKNNRLRDSRHISISIAAVHTYWTIHPVSTEPMNKADRITIETAAPQIAESFTTMLVRKDIAIILINQHVNGPSAAAVYIVDISPIDC